jgi:hypothetical protein
MSIDIVGIFAQELITGNVIITDNKVEHIVLQGEESKNSGKKL